MKRGDFVRHPKRHEWGIGIVIEEPSESECKIFFENEGKAKTLRRDHVTLEVVVDPGASRGALENALLEPQTAAAKFRPFPDVLEKFLEDFPGGFQGEMFLRYERDYKVKAHEWTMAHMSQKSMHARLESGELGELHADMRRLYQTTNLLASFELIKLGDSLKTPTFADDLVLALYTLLYGTDPFAARFNQFVTTLARDGLDKWPIATYPLFIRHPEQFIFVKPNMIREAAVNSRFDIHYTSNVSAGAYENMQSFARSLWDKLRNTGKPETSPRDMIDIQSFMWCTYAGGWTSDGVAKAKRELGLR